MEEKRQTLIIALLGLVTASEHVRQAVSDLRDEKVFDTTNDIHEALIQLHALFAPEDERQKSEMSETLVALEGSLAGFICNLTEITLRPALGELTLLESVLDSDAREVLPLLHILVDGLKGDACAS